MPTHKLAEPTNKAKGRVLRHTVIWREMSFDTQSTAGSLFAETMLSEIETCCQQNRDVFDAVKVHFKSTATDQHRSERE